MTRAALATLGLLLFAGCASVDPRPTFDSVAETVTARSGAEPAWARTESEEDAAELAAARLLADPLDDRSVAQIALLRNREGSRSHNHTPRFGGSQLGLVARIAEKTQILGCRSLQ